MSLISLNISVPASHTGTISKAIRSPVSPILYCHGLMRWCRRICSFSPVYLIFITSPPWQYVRWNGRSKEGWGVSAVNIALYCGWGAETGGSMIKLLLRYIFPTITHIYRLQNHWTLPLSTFSAFYLRLWYIQLFLIWSLYCVELGPGPGFSAGRARGIKRKNISPNYFPHIKGKDILCPPYYDSESKLGKSAPACCRQEAQIFLGIL